MRRATTTPLAVGVEILARLQLCAGKAQRRVELTFTALIGLDRAGAQRLDPQVDGLEDLHVPHGAVDHQTPPAVLRRRGGQQVTEQGAAQGSAAVDHDHPTQARRANGLSHQRIVFEAANRNDFAAEFAECAKITKNRVENDDFVDELVTYVGNGMRHGIGFFSVGSSKADIISPLIPPCVKRIGAHVASR